MNLRNRLPWLAAAVAVAILLYYLAIPHSPSSGNETFEAPEPSTDVSQSGPASPAPAGSAPTLHEGPTTVPAVIQYPTPPAEPAQSSQTSSSVSVSGSIFDLQGSPVPRAVIQTIFTLNGSQKKANALSDSKGRFMIAGIGVPQLDLLTAEAPGFGRSIVSDKEQLLLPIENLEISLSRLSGAELKILAVTPNELAPQPFTGEAIIYLMLRQEVEATSQAAGLAEASDVPGSYQTISNENVSIENGQYTLKDVPPGVYKAAILAGEQYAESEPFRAGMGAGSQTVLTLGLRKSFAGQVQSQSRHLPVVNADVAMLLSSRPLAAGRPQPPVAKTDGEGRFHFDALVPGVYTLTIQAAGFTSKSIERIDIAPSTPPPAPQVYFMVEGLPSVSVSVKDGDGKPLSGSALVLFTSAGDQPRTFFGKTDVAGFYRFDSIPSGRYTIAATAADNKSRQKSTDVVVAEGENKNAEITFGHLVKVAGMAFSKGKPIEGVIAFSERGAAGLPIYTKAKENGAYTLDIEPGEYMVSKQGQSGRALVKIPDGETASIDFDLK